MMSAAVVGCSCFYCCSLLLLDCHCKYTTYRQWIVIMNVYNCSLKLKAATRYRPNTYFISIFCDVDVILEIINAFRFLRSAEFLYKL